eukprot:59717_1
MSRFYIFYIVSFLLHSTHTQQYFANNQDYLQYREPYTSTATETIKVAYPINECTRTGNHMTDGGASHGIYQCSSGGTIIYGPCVTTEAGCLAKAISCDNNFDGILAGNLYYTDFSSGESCPDGQSTTSINYMTITFYCGTTTNSRPNNCPFDTGIFSPRGIAKFATNICVDQGDGDYFMATCNNETAEIGLYDSITCNNRKAEGVIPGVYRQYTRSCDNYAYPNPASDSCNYFRRVTECMVNGVNILLATTKPTAAPTRDPSLSPTDDPSVTPSVFPTLLPTADTQPPAMPPTIGPTLNPSIPPTNEPTMDPTISPTTSEPTEEAPRTTAEELKPAVTVKQAGAVFSSLNNLSLMYIVCSVLFVFYMFIGCYIWMNERRKRKEMTHMFQKEMDKDERREYLRQKNLQRRMQIQQEMGVYGGYGGYDGHGPGAVHVEQPKKAVIKPVDVQLLQEGM